MAFPRLVLFGPAEPFFPSLCCIHRAMKVAAKVLLWPFGERQSNMTHINNKPTPKLRKAPQPPLVVLVLTRAGTAGQLIQAAYQGLVSSMPFIERTQEVTRRYMASIEPDGE